MNFNHQVLRKVKKTYEEIFNGNCNKEKKKILKALEAISTSFLNKYEFKYGYIRPSIFTRLINEIQQRVLSNDRLTNEVREGKSDATVLAYLFLCERCQSFLCSCDSPDTEQLVSYDQEAMVDILKFSLEGLCFERFLDHASLQDLIKQTETRLSLQT